MASHIILNARQVIRSTGGDIRLGGGGGVCKH